MKVLISAYACEPGRGSEPGVGWNWGKQAARFHEVWVLTRANNRAAIEAELLRHPDRALHFSYVDLPRWASFWKRGGKGLHLYYCLWQVAAYLRAKKLHAQIGFQLCHHLTFGNFWLPTLLWRLPVPLVWGPLGGYESVPRPFWKLFSFRAQALESIRSLLQFCACHLDPNSRKTSQKASLIIGRTAVTSALFSRDYPDKVLTLVETGIDRLQLENAPAPPQRAPGSGGLQVLMVGRLIHWKGFALGIAAFQKLAAQDRQATLQVIGSGPEEASLRRLAARAGLAHRVVFHGQLPHGELAGHYENADLFLYPSLKDAGAWVVFEAMACGLPVICFDYAGPGEIVTDCCGIKIAPGHPEQAVAGFAAALLCLAKESGLRKILGDGARKRLAQFVWEKKGDCIAELYARAAGEPRR